MQKATRNYFKKDSFANNKRLRIEQSKLDKNINTSNWSKRFTPATLISLKNSSCNKYISHGYDNYTYVEVI